MNDIKFHHVSTDEVFGDYGGTDELCIEGILEALYAAPALAPTIW